MSGNWSDIGYKDGRSGDDSSKLSEHRKACSEYHITPDPTQYNEGRQRGLLVYCTADNALQEGLSGNYYQGVCPGDSEPDFLNKYQQGQAIYNLQQEIRKHEDRILTINTTLEYDKKKPKLSASKIKKYEQEIIELDVRIEEKQKRLYYMKGQAGVPL